LVGLKKIYDEIPSQPSETVASTDPNAAVTTVENKSSYKLSPEQLTAISEKASQIRNKIIQ
jgi:hypothetical protein